MPENLISVAEERSLRCPETGASFYTIQYEHAKLPEMLSLASYRIISRLKNENDLILELDSALLATPANERMEIATNTKTRLDALGLLSKSHKSRIPQNPTIFERLLKGNAANECEILHALFYIPAHVWNQDNFWSYLPIHGTRYYLLKDGVLAGEIMEEIFNGTITGEQKVRFFDWSIFDCGILGQMGIYAYRGVSKDEIRKRLTGLSLS